VNPIDRILQSFFRVPTALSDADATRLGLKAYSHGTTYRGGNSPTIVLAGGGGTLSSVTKSLFVPRQLQNGTWVLSGSARVVLSSAVRTSVALAVAGTDTIGDDAIAMSQLDNGSAFTALAYTGGSVGTGMRLIIAHGSATTTLYTYSFADIVLTAKPTWAF
jgi:hypothetical protein